MKGGGKLPTGKGEGEGELVNCFSNAPWAEGPANFALLHACLNVDCCKDRYSPGTYNYLLSSFATQALMQCEGKYDILPKLWQSAHGGVMLWKESTGPKSAAYGLDGAS